MKKYFFENVEYPEIGIVSEEKEDSNIFKQRIGGLSKVPFPDYRKAYENVELPNVKKFLEIVEDFRSLMAKGAPERVLIKEHGLHVKLRRNLYHDRLCTACTGRSKVKRSRR